MWHGSDTSPACAEGGGGTGDPHLLARLKVRLSWLHRHKRVAPVSTVPPQRRWLCNLRLVRVERSQARRSPESLPCTTSATLRRPVCLSFPGPDAFMLQYCVSQRPRFAKVVAVCQFDVKAHALFLISPSRAQLQSQVRIDVKGKFRIRGLLQMSSAGCQTPCVVEQKSQKAISIPSRPDGGRTGTGSALHTPPVPQKTRAFLVKDREGRGGYATSCLVNPPSSAHRASRL